MVMLSIQRVEENGKLFWTQEFVNAFRSVFDDHDFSPLESLLPEDRVNEFKEDIPLYFDALLELYKKNKKSVGDS